MAWQKGIVIRGGEYEGSTIGISSVIPDGFNWDYVFQNNNMNYAQSATAYNTEEIFFVNDFDNYIDVSDIVRPDGAEFSDLCLADIAIIDTNKNVSGYFSLYVSRQNSANMILTVTGKIKNASGVILGSFNGAASFVSGYYSTAKCYLCFVKTTYNNNTLYGLFLNFDEYAPYGEINYSYYSYAGAFLNNDTIYQHWNISGNIDSETKQKSPEFGKASEPAGGYNPDGTHGTFDDSSDIVPVPHLPTKGVTSAGFINVYVIQDNELVTLGEKLFPHFLPAELLKDPSQMTVPEMLAVILKSFFGTLISPVGSTVELADNLGIIDILMNGKLIDYVLDCHIIPTAISGATVEGLKVGYRQFNDLQLAKATSDYVEIDCGSLSIGEYWANFLDYSCTVKLFLPFVGFVPIENEYWNGGTIKVIYHFNIIDGSFQVYVVSTSSKSELKETVIGQYGGVCCIHMPITGLQYSNVVAGLVNGTAGAVASGYGGDVAGAVTNALNMAMLRPDAPSSNGYNASSSFLSERFPYLLIERPASQFSEMYNKEMGLPLNVMEKLSNVHGFTVIDNPVLKIACSDAEYKELVSLLKNGVILP